MKIRGVLLLLVLLVPALALAQRPLPVGKLAVSDAATVAQIDAEKLKGQPARLAWSPDGTELYVQMLDGTFGKPGAVTRHYVFTLANGDRKEVNAEPAWAATYWTRKSGQASLDDPAFKIGVETTQRVERTVSTPMGGDLARGAPGAGGDVGGGTGGTSSGEAIAAAAGMQNVAVHTMKLAGEVVGEFVNSVIVPGLTFGWGPSGSKVIVFAKPKGGELVIMDSARKKQELDGTKDALLPAFSEDGTRLAWLRKDGKKKYALHVANVSPR